MLQLKPDSHKVPYGGHHYTESGQTFRGDSFAAVVAKVTDFRLYNNIPAGNPTQDILQFYAANWPWLVKSDPHAQPEEINEQYNLWRAWIYHAWRHPPRHFVAAPQREDRTNICRDCPYNEQFKFEETKESAELTRRSYLLRQGQEASQDLGFCRLHRADLAAFTSFQSPAEPHPEQPRACWVGVI